MGKQYLLSVLVICFQIYEISSESGCAEPLSIKSCVCREGAIYCDEINASDFAQVLIDLKENISKPEIQLNDKSITYLKDNTPKDIVFNGIIKGIGNWTKTHILKQVSIQTWSQNQGNSINNKGPNLFRDVSLRPCYIEGTSTMICDKNELTGTQLKQLFKRFSLLSNKKDKHFEKLQVIGTRVEDLPDNTFSDITFDEIEFIQCRYLSTVHRNAFLGTNEVTKSIKFRNLPKLALQGNAIFQALSTIVNLEKLSLDQTKINEIPSMALRPYNGYKERLSSIHIKGELKSIKKNAFYYLKNLTSFKLEMTAPYNAKTPLIQDNAFGFESGSKTTLELKLNLISGPSNIFSEKSLVNIKRPVNLFLSGNQFTYLDTKVFKPFLLDNPSNRLQMDHWILDCNDCHNYWLAKNQDLLARVGTTCSNSARILDKSNFKNC